MLRPRRDPLSPGSPRAGGPGGATRGRGRHLPSDLKPITIRKPVSLASAQARSRLPGVRANQEIDGVNAPSIGIDEELGDLELLHQATGRADGVRHATDRSQKTPSVRRRPHRYPCGGTTINYRPVGARNSKGSILGRSFRRPHLLYYYSSLDRKRERTVTWSAPCHARASFS
jgi:hypothetical protein